MAPGDRYGRRRTQFSDDLGTPSPPSKRQRTARACDQCRSKKNKCNGAAPICSACSTAGSICTYSVSTKKRGMRTGYVRLLESLWGLVFQKIPTSEDTVKSLLEQCDLSYDSEGQVQLAGEVMESFRQTFMGSSVSTELNQLQLKLEALSTEKSDQPSSPQTLAEISGDANMTFPDWSATTVRGSGAVPDQHRGSSPSKSPNAEPLSSLETPDGVNNQPFVPGIMLGTFGARSFRPDPPSVPSLDPNALPPNTGRLLDVYFAYTHCWLPIIEKHDALRVSYSTSNPVTNPSGDVAALWAILAYSSLQESPAIRRDSSQSQGEDTHLTPTLLYETARALIPKENANFEPGHVQALLLLSMVNLGSGLWVSASILVGQAIRITLSASEDWGRSASNKYRKLLAGCFIIDTLVSARLGSLPHLRTAGLRTNHIPDISNFD